MQLDIQDLDIRYGKSSAVRELSLHLAPGEIGCLLGPSGCGKTSLLRAIGGFEKPAAGEIRLAGNIVCDSRVFIAPEKRRVGMMFQDIALFPHLNVLQNVEFGLFALEKEEKRKRSEELLSLIGLETYALAFPHELSGGQQQRVALARAIAPKPELLLMDEPFSSLDSELSEQIAGEVRSLLKHHGISALVVTHDQHEAFAMADNLGVMCEGRLLQWASSYDVYHKPVDRFVAGFIGEGTFVAADVAESGELVNGLGRLAEAGQWQAGARYDVLVRPDDLVYQPESALRCEILNKHFRGAEYFYEIRMADGQEVVCATPSHVDLAVGDLLPVELDLAHLVVFPID